MKTEISKCIVVTHLLLFISGISGLLSYGPAFAAEKGFPNKEITIIVGMSAGGGRDTLARGLGKTWSKYLGVPLVVVNEPGAGGARAAIHIYHAAPDGYTIGIATSTEIVDQALALRDMDYDNKKYTYIGRAVSSPELITVRSDSPLKSLKDLKAFGKTVRHGTFSLTTPSTIATVALQKRMGFPMTIVAGYGSSLESTMGLIRGEFEFSGPMPSACIQYLRSGQIRPIASVFPKRTTMFPDVPTLGELGYPDLGLMSIDQWFVAPPETPKDRLQTLENTFMKAVKDPEFIEFAKTAAIDVDPLTGDETLKSVLSLLNIYQGYVEDMKKYIKVK